MADDDKGSGPGAANNDQDDGDGATTFTQAQVNKIAAREKRGALGAFFKELGLDTPPDVETLKATFDAAAEHKKLKDGEKGDVERLGGQLASEKEKSAKIPTLETTILRQQIAGTEQLPPRFWRYVEGKTDDEIKESIKELKTELNLTTDDGGDGGDGGQGNGQQQVTGTGAHPPEPNQQQGRNNGGGTPTKTLAAGREAYAAKHPKKE